MKSLQPPACNRLAVKQLAGRLKTLKKKNGFTQHHFDCFGILKPLNLNRRLKLRENGAGFTLLELLVVIAVLGILAATVMVLIDPASKMAKSRDAQRRSDIRQIAQALELYEIDKGSYPGQTRCDSSYGSNDSFSCDDGSWNPGTNGAWATTSDIYTKLVGEEYVKKLPLDPTNKRISWTGHKYYYYNYDPFTGTAGLCSSGITCRYWIAARLEKPQDDTKPIFRCSDNEDLSQGVGCKEVADWSQSPYPFKE